MNIKIDKTCRTVLSQTMGLMFSRKKTLLFIFKKEKRISLHNWFVFYPITLIFLNKDMEIVEIREHFKPFQFYKSRNKANYLIEIPYKTCLTLNQKINIK